MSINAMTAPPSKILLTSSTKVSLNDRFTKLGKIQPHKEQVVVVGQSLKDIGDVDDDYSSDEEENDVYTTKPKISMTMPAGTASNRNRHLASQMANKLAMQAALRIKNKSIRQRPPINIGGGGSNSRAASSAAALRSRVSAPAGSARRRRPTPPPPPLPPRRMGGGGALAKRLSGGGLRGVRGKPAPVASAVFKSANRELVTAASSLQSRLSGVSTFGANSFDSSRLSGLSKTAGVPLQRGGGRGGPRGGGGGLSDRIGRVGNGGRVMRKGGQVLSRGGGRPIRGGVRSIRGVRPVRGGVARGRGGFANKRSLIGRGGIARKATPGQPKSREGLDMDLDQYMSKTKGHLDADLDTYMTKS